MHWGYYGYGMGLGMILWWALIIGAVILLVLGGTRIFKARNEQKLSPIQDSSLIILRERYAKGEISKEEYEQIRQELITKR